MLEVNDTGNSQTGRHPKLLLLTLDMDLVFGKNVSLRCPDLIFMMLASNLTINFNDRIIVKTEPLT